MSRNSADSHSAPEFDLEKLPSTEDKVREKSLRNSLTSSAEFYSLSNQMEGKIPTEEDALSTVGSVASAVYNPASRVSTNDSRGFGIIGTLRP